MLALPQAAPKWVYVALTEGLRPDHDIYAVEIATGERHLLRRNNVGAEGWVFDFAGSPRLATRTGKNGSVELVRLDTSGSAVIYSCSWSETCTSLQFDPDGRHVYLASNHGANADLVRLISLDVRNGHEEVVASDPAQEVDLDETVFSPQTRRPAATVYKGDAGLRYAWLDRGMQADFQRLRSHLPDKDLRLQSTDDGQYWLVFASADREPGEAYLFDRRTGALTLQYRLLPLLPRGVRPKSVPLVVLPHEGPWNVRAEWGYSNLAQFLANRGFAVLQPNFRGSIGFGKRFLAAGDRQWGERMQDDINSGARQLVASGIADPKRIAIFGLSYGGFAALAGAAFTPDLYTAAIDWSGPSDLTSLVKQIPRIKHS